MSDVQMIELARPQHRCVAWAQLLSAGFSERVIEGLVDSGRFVALHEGVYAIAPVYPDDRQTRWMAATLTAPNTFLALASAAAAHGFRPFDASFEMVVRPGSGGPEQYDGLRVSRSETLEGNTTGSTASRSPRSSEPSSTSAPPWVRRH